MTYSNSRNPKAMKWIMWSSLIIGFTFYIVAFASEKDFWNILGMSLYLIFYCLFFWLIRKSEYCTLDEEAGVVFTGETKKYPMKIDSIRSITYKESKKGKFRSVHPRHRGRLLQYTHKQKDCRCHRRKVDLPQPGHHCNPFKLPVTFPIAVTSPSFTSKKHRISHTEEC